jgi:hypothetical protein
MVLIGGVEASGLLALPLHESAPLNAQPLHIHPEDDN